MSIVKGRVETTWVAAATLCLALLAGCGRDARPPEPAADHAPPAEPGELVRQARIALSRNNFGKTSHLIQQALATSPNHPEALELAADLAVRGDDTAGAIRLYRQATDAQQQPPKQLWDKLAEQWAISGAPFQAIDVLEQAIADHPQAADLRQKCAGLQASVGLERDAAPHLRWLVQHGRGDVNLLIILSNLSRPQTVESTCESALQRYPEERRPQYALARLPAYHGRWDEAAELLEPVVQRHPGFAPARAFYGRALVELDRAKRLPGWLADATPPGLSRHPQYWLAAGIWADRQGRIRQAARAYWRAVERDENHLEALNRLAAALRRLGRESDAVPFSQRAAELAGLRDAVDSLLSWRKNSQQAVVEIAQHLERLGRRWEAVVWLQQAFRMTDQPAPELKPTYTAMRGKLDAQTPWQLPEPSLAGRLDLSDFPLVDWNPAASPPADTQPASSTKVTIRMRDEAAQRGLRHTCRIGKAAGREASLGIFQSGAGGVGVLDFDLDGWPDVLLTQMDGTPRQEDSRPNRLFRNRDGHFRDVTTASRAIDHGYSQGIAIGDYNSDGFPDVLVANLGRDSLFRNNGDGTFSEVTESVRLSGQQWTTSAAWADIDLDGIADLFQVGYCDDPSMFDQPCVDADLGESRSCSPLVFDAQTDRVWRGTPTGGFEEVTERWLGEHAAGRGFGVVAGQLDDEAGLDLVIANDMTANHYWTRATETQEFRLSEQATARGLAFNARSVAQASMGIAAGDADQDGDVDLLMTHFSNDHNTFYEQVAPGLWSDRSHPSGLAEPSLATLGYGTQWIDLNSDGVVELMVANGDIDDFSHEGRAFRQHPQLFYRQPQGRWLPVAGETVGPYFTSARLGRAVARLDANRDGQPDLIVTHLFDPVALLVNESPAAGHQLRFFLRGVDSHRGSVGTTVQFTANGRTHLGQLFGGHGYQCTNEQCVSFGIGSVSEIERVVVTWPDGSQDRLERLPAGRDYLVVQGQKDAFAFDPPVAAGTH